MPHTLVQQLIGVVDRKETVGQPTSLELLDVFWDEVAKLGTPLIEETARGMRATFLFRESVEHMITVDAYTGVWVEWRSTYAGGHRVALQRLERTNVWWAEIEIPPDFTGMYTYVMADRDGIITEDIHEPWPMSFDDEFNPRETTDVDMAYRSNLLTTKASTTGSAGSISTVLVPAERLPLPPRTWRRGAETRTEPHPESYPVWCYIPNRSAWETSTTTLPLIVLMPGQFLESMDLAAALDHSIESGSMPPAVVAGPGYFREGHKAWGWRNGYGPGELSEFFVHSLLPTLARELPVEPIAHLVAWDYTTYSAIETARRIPGQIRSITLLDPSPHGLRDRDRFWRFDWSIADAASDLSRRAPGFPIAIGVPPTRDGDFAWSYDNDQVVRSGMEEADLHLVDFQVSDPNIVAAGEALGNAIAVVAPLSHELDEAYIAAHPVTEPAP